MPLLSADGGWRRLCARVWEGIIKLEVFVIFNFLKQRVLSRRKKKKQNN